MRRLLNRGCGRWVERVFAIRVETPSDGVNSKTGRLEAARRSMRWRGLEPPRPMRPLGPQPSASTNSATSARGSAKCSAGWYDSHRASLDTQERAGTAVTRRRPEAALVGGRSQAGWLEPTYDSRTSSGSVPADPCAAFIAVTSYLAGHKSASFSILYCVASPRWALNRFNGCRILTPGEQGSQESPTLIMAVLATQHKGVKRMSSGIFTLKDGTQIYYKDWGSGQPIVFSHGWPLDADDWDAQMLFFSSQRLSRHRARPARPRPLDADRGTATTWTPTPTTSPQLVEAPRPARRDARRPFDRRRRGRALRRLGTERGASPRRC